jgi:hypothetical protein
MTACIHALPLARINGDTCPALVLSNPSSWDQEFSVSETEGRGGWNVVESPHVKFKFWKIDACSKEG